MFNLSGASDKLSQLDIRFQMENLYIEIPWFRVMECKGEWEINRHSHSSFEFHFIYCGACHVVLDDREFQVKAGEFYLTGPGMFHRQEAVPGENLSELCVNYDIKLLDINETEALCLYHILKRSSCRPFKDDLGIMSLFHKALLEADAHQTGFYSNIKCLAAMILSTSARAITKGKRIEIKAPVKVKKNEYRLKQIEKFIDDNITSQIRVGDIAKVMFLSTKQVGRIIGQAYGMTTKDFIMQKRLRKAKQLLKNSDLSIKEISNVLGFSSEYYFSQFFKKHEGYSPSIYRNNVSNVL